MLVEQLRNPSGGDRKSRVSPDDPRLGIVTKQDEQRLLVAMRVEVQISFDGEIHDLFHPCRFRRLSVNMKFSDAAVKATRIFVLDQLEDGRIVEPGLDVAAHAIRSDERDHPQLGPLCIRKLKRPFVWTAVGDDSGYSIAPKYVAYLFKRIKRCRLLVVMQMGVEDFDTLLCAGIHRRRCEKGKRGQ